jgi:glycine/D-amino acid oxidase-like deaminating enzyme
MSAEGAGEATRHETVIVGGGIAGLACARRLAERESRFLLVTEDIGGRIHASRDGSANLGAYYVRDDYVHVNRFVERGRRIRRRQMLRGNDDGSFSRSDLPLLRHLPQTLRFIRVMRAFRHHYDAFKQDCLLVSQAEAIRSNPVLLNLYREPARRFVRRHRIEDISRSYLAPAIQGTGFTSLDGLTAFTLLVGVLPTVIPIYEYAFRFDRLTAGFEDDILIDTVTEIASTPDGYAVRTRLSGDFTAANVVVATPTGVSARLLGLDSVKSPRAAHMFIVEGNLRLPWAAAPYSLFPENHSIFALARLSTGATLFSASSSDPDFALYFHTWNVVEHHHWDPAFHLGGDVLLDCEQRPGLFLVGDHNVCDLEDTYITGLHAANRILGGESPTTFAVGGSIPPRSAGAESQGAAGVGF